MSTREMAYSILSTLSEEQIKAFITLFGRGFSNFEETEPDEVDKWLISDSLIDNDESMPLDDFIRSMGMDPDDL
ncbi:MAG: hypothetical protein SPK18_04710 [Treponema sp.]|nr:hypothetical protein [Oscillospiraceae bacterium]MDD6824576.1 hypothetical protein [Oscillospiraceae bacterium]MDD7534176.1 hypothetical protein [Treponema sp.]MDY5757863.1 hypothetical protein [Treponema sp.]